VVSYNTVSEFCTSPFANQGCEDPGKRNLLPQKWPYTRLVELKGKPFDQYVEKFASRRVVSGPGTISCFEMFRSIANNFALGSDWTISYPNVQWFVYDDRWPSCGGYNCTGKIMRKSADDSFYSEVEPVKNYCIDRWKNDPWSSYESELLNACKNTETYKKAVSEAALNGAAEDMANACLKKEECKYLSNSISDLINEKLLISKLHSHVEAIKDKDQVAKNDRISYLIPSFDPYFSILNEIDRYISHLDSGYESLISIHMSTGAKWNLGMEKITGKSMPIGFQSPDELKETIEGYKRLILEMKNLSKNQIVTQTCSWSAVGGFRKFDGFRVNEIRRSNVEGSNKIEKFISIAPVEID
jgi:hypothetical protein